MTTLSARDLERFADGVSLGMGRAPAPEALVRLTDAAVSPDAQRLAMLALAAQRRALALPLPTSPLTRPPPVLPPDARLVPAELRPYLIEIADDTVSPLPRAAVAATLAAGLSLHPFDFGALAPLIGRLTDLVPAAVLDALGMVHRVAPRWQERPPAQRQEALERLRHLDAAAAREEIAAFLTTASAQERADAVAVLMVGLSADDRPLLDALVSDRSAKVKERVEAALARIPGTPACEARVRRVAETSRVERRGLLFKHVELTFSAAATPTGKERESDVPPGPLLSALLAAVGVARADFVKRPPKLLGAERSHFDAFLGGALLEGDTEAARAILSGAEPAAAVAFVAAWPEVLLAYGRVPAIRLMAGALQGSLLALARVIHQIAPTLFLRPLDLEEARALAADPAAAHLLQKAIAENPLFACRLAAAWPLSEIGQFCRQVLPAGGDALGPVRAFCTYVAALPPPHAVLDERRLSGTAGDPTRTPALGAPP